MQPQDIALLHSRSRIAVGLGLVVLPGLTGRTWIGPDASRTPVKVALRALGVRDLALGLGVSIALDRGAPVRGWLEACALSDTVDLLATVAGGDSIPQSARAGVSVIAAGSAVLCGMLSRALDHPRPKSDVQSPEAALTGHPA